MNSAFRYLLSCSIAVLATCFSLNATDQRPNIVWLIAEDLSPDLGCYGYEDAYTPHVDALAKTGVRYTNAFATGAVCSASRSALVTGLYQNSLGAGFHRTMKKNQPTLPEGVETVFDRFLSEGYFVDYNGKTDLNFQYNGKGIQHRDLSEREKGQPFFMEFQTSHTHRPFHRNVERPINPDKLSIPSYYPEHPLTRRDWADYCEDIQLMDKWLGERLNYLKDNDLLDNTIVIFFGDHGRPHVRDKQFLYDGGLKVPLIIRDFRKETEGKVVSDLVSLVDLVPTLMDWAEIEKPHHLQGHSLSSKEKRKYVFAARDRSGDASECMRSIRSENYLLIKNDTPDIPWMQKSSYKIVRYPVYSLMHLLNERGELTPDQAKFMASAKPEYELYDVSTDPEQIHNIAAENPEVVKELSKELAIWRKTIEDQVEDPDQNDMVVKLASKEKWLQSFYQEAGLPADPSFSEIVEYWESTLL